MKRTLCIWRAAAVAVTASLLWTTTAAHASERRTPAGLTVADLQARYPHARLVQVSPEAFARACAAGQASGAGDAHVILLAQALPEGVAVPGTATHAVPAPTDTNAVTAAVSNAPALPVEAAPVERRPARVAHSTPDVVPSGSCNIMGDLDLGDDAAVVVFVLIGVVVVAALVVYTGGYIVNMVTGERDYDYWAAVEAHSSWVVGGNENGYLLGGRLAVGFVNGAAHAGIAVEVGHLDVDVDTEGQPEPVPLQGLYVMAGPAIRWALGDGPNPPCVFVEMLGGVTDQSNVDMVSMARAGFSLGLGPHVRWGLSVGALYLNLNPDEGVIRQEDDFTGLVGTEIGVRF